MVEKRHKWFSTSTYIFLFDFFKRLQYELSKYQEIISVLSEMFLSSIFEALSNLISNIDIFQTTTRKRNSIGIEKLRMSKNRLLNTRALNIYSWT